MWDISSAGHISAGDSSLVSTRRELEEELGVTLPMDAFELLFVFLQEWYKQNVEERSLALQKQLNRYASISLSAEVWYNNPDLRDWLKEHADTSPLAKLKWKYYMINKSPWYVLAGLCI